MLCLAPSGSPVSKWAIMDVLHSSHKFHHVTLYQIEDSLDKLLQGSDIYRHSEHQYCLVWGCNGVAVLERNDIQDKVKFLVYFCSCEPQGDRFIHVTGITARFHQGNLTWRQHVYGTKHSFWRKHLWSI